ncbi:TonB-dependent receptor plug domain-containing protein [Chryseobacterium koreense]|uniref:TonB-dependent receptor n=1 Tax=Chryseobacterium koreense CCUG 49689 TaxID=1304281 RepID=A0A0J7LPU8_9FLAO|nr:TonB-dependent receptor [Chryseobacterium koreense]KMQ71070.1 TonB-dependent receptor [Chryseobacterium koreense CCUG 49689]MBB5332836.1 iron complex outermembrane receptor protein [Chryseobacterium koreense]
MFKTLPILSAVLLLFSFSIAAQEKTIDTVFIFDNQLVNAKKIQKTSKLKEEDLLKNATNLSEVLRFQSPIYIKESGRGMVSAPSFRGTTAQQTAFVWNGINVNSQFLGQGDLNNLNLLGYDHLEIQSGGGSVIYGSSAIGGTIHLNNELSFNRGLKNSAFFEYGSFETYNTFLKSSFSNEKLSVKLAANYSESENNYEVPEKQYINLNGQYHNKNFSLGFGYKIDDRNTVFWQSQLYSGNQHYPIFSEFSTKTKYLTDNFRSLLSWNFRGEKVQNILKWAYLEEEFDYFQNIDNPKSSGGIGKNYIAKNDFNYSIKEKIDFNLITEFQVNKAEGYLSGIQNISRNAGSVAGLIRWKPSKKMYLEAGAKKEFVEKIEAPFLFSFSGNIQLADYYSLTFNASKNFRYPTFNDLYWKPGGNLDLKPEISHQAELGNRFKYKNFKLNLTPYYMQIENMIRWLPTSSGIWSPINTEKVESYGLESQLDFENSFGKNHAKISAGFIFTHSKDLETNRFLMYVPKYKFFANASYRYDFAEIFLQGMYNGLTFTTSDESISDALKSYFVANAGLNLTFLKHYRFGFKIQNIFDQIYETTAFYPLPKRNYSVNLLINF